MFICTEVASLDIKTKIINFVCNYSQTKELLRPHSIKSKRTVSDDLPNVGCLG